MKKSLFLIAICIAITLMFSCSRLFLNQTVKKDSEILFQALQATNEIEDFYNKSAAVERIARMYAADGEYDKAFLVAKSIEDTNIKAFALARISRQAWESGQKDKASEILAQAYEVAKTITDAHVKAYTLAMVADEYAKAGQKEKAGELLPESST